MGDYATNGQEGVQDICQQMRDVGIAAGFVVRLSDPHANSHAVGTRVQARLQLGENKTTIVYDVVYCPIQDRVYVDSRREEDIIMNDFSTFEEFVQKSKAIDELVEKLLPEKPMIFSFGPTGKTK